MRRSPRYLVLLLALIGGLHYARAQADVVCADNHNGMCVFPHPTRPGQSSNVDFACNDGTALYEKKFVCLKGVNKGQAFDLFCRAGGSASSESVRNHDFKCNIKQPDACPNSGQLTQFTDEEHCEHKASGNWKLPPNYKVPPELK